MRTGRRTELLLILLFPALLTIGILLIPVVTDYTDHALAEQAVSQTGRWFWGHLLAALAFGLSPLAVNVVEAHLAQTKRPFPLPARPLTALGAGLYAFGLGADGVGPVAVQASGSSPTLFFDGSGFWVTGVFIAGTALFGLGLMSMVVAANEQALLQGRARYLTFISVWVFMLAPMILSGWALYGVALAIFGIFLPLGRAVDGYIKN